MGWTQETLCFSPDTWFEELKGAIGRANSKVILETYIFSDDHLGGEIWDSLVKASARGVSVRLIVDGFGSASWIGSMRTSIQRAQFEVRIFNPLPVRIAQLSSGIWSPLSRAFRMLLRLNQRDHRKLLVIDDSTAWVGSWNVSASHFGLNKTPWHDSGCILEGPSIGEIVASFENRWQRCFSPQKPALPQFLGKLIPLTWRRERIHSQSVLVMDDRKSRRLFRREIYHHISTARGRIWLTTAYFNPAPKLVLALLSAARNGNDVRILISARSDVAFVHLLSEFFYRQLFAGGVRIFEYQTAMLHAKNLIAGDWVMLGSLNMNFRSFYRDHEIGVVLSSQQAMAAMSERFLMNLTESQEIVPKAHQARSFWNRFFSFLLFRLRVLF